MTKPPRVRFAPSPTGYLHIGGARTALFNWLHARRHGGSFILRMEDTDRARSTPESVKAILDGLEWLGIDWDEGPGKEGPYAPYFQTQRLASYKEWSDKLLAKGLAYKCYCAKDALKLRREAAEKEKRTYKYEGTCRNRTDSPGLPYVIRFKMPQTDGNVSFDDKVLGNISKAYSDLDDWVMLREDGIPLYNYGCVIDDHLMDITLVARGQEHVNSTFPQLALYQALGWTPPEFAHMPLILGADREKLSKRKHPEADVMRHRANGIIPHALLNFVVRLGWSHGDDETFTREQMIQYFDFEQVGSTSGVWNPDRLLFLNQFWMKLMPLPELAGLWVPFLKEKGFDVQPDERIQRIAAALRERQKSLKEMAEVGAYFFQQGVTLDDKAAAKHLNAEGKALLAQARAVLETTPWQIAPLDDVVKIVAEKAGVGMGKVAQPMRVAVTGNTASPGMGETLELIGREESLRRIDSALARP